MDAGQAPVLVRGDPVVNGVLSAVVRLGPDLIKALEPVAVFLTTLLTVEVLLTTLLFEVMKPEVRHDADAL